MVLGGVPEQVEVQGPFWAKNDLGPSDLNVLIL